MAAIVLHCPNCQKAYPITPEQVAKYAGKTIVCKNCKQPFSFDAAMDAAAQAAGQAEAAADDDPAVGAAAGYPDAGYQDAGYHDSAADPAGAAAVAAPAPRPPAAPRPLVPPRAPTAPPPPPPAPVASVVPEREPYEAVYGTQESYQPPAGPAVAVPQAAPPFPGAPVPSPEGAFSGVALPGVAPVGYAAGPVGGGGVGDLFSFRRMGLPAVLPLAFWVGVAFCVYNGLGTLSHLIIAHDYRGQIRIVTEGLFDRLFSVYALTTVLDGLFWLILGPLVWRGFCDLILAASRLTGDPSRR